MTAIIHTCRDCGATTRDAEFQRNSRRKSGWAERCKPCEAAYRLEVGYRRANAVADAAKRAAAERPDTGGPLPRRRTLRERMAAKRADEQAATLTEQVNAMIAAMKRRG